MCLSSEKWFFHSFDEWGTSACVQGIDDGSKMNHGTRWKTRTAERARMSGDTATNKHFAMRYLSAVSSNNTQHAPPVTVNPLNPTPLRLSISPKRHSPGSRSRPFSVGQNRDRGWKSCPGRPHWPPPPDDPPCLPCGRTC